MSGRLFSDVPFRRLFVAQTVSRWGDTFNAVAIVILVFQLTGSGLRVAATVAFEIVPVLVLAPIAGVIADRFPKARVMVAADLWRAALLLALVVGPHDLPIIYPVAFGLAAGSVFFNPASGGLLPTLVDPDRLVEANSALWSAAVVSQIALAPLAGALVGAAGARPAFAVNAASFVLSAVVLRGLPAVETDEAARESWRHQLAEGLRMVRGEPLVRILATVQLLGALSAGGTSALLVVLAERRLDLGPSGFGLLLAAIGVGAAVGPWLLARWLRGRAPANYVFGAFALRGGVDLLLATTRNPFVAAGGLAAYGVGTSTGTVVFQSIIQSRLRPNVQGRAFALFDLVWQGGRLASLGAGGAVADAAGVTTVYLAGGVLLLLAAVVGATWSARMRVG